MFTTLRKTKLQDNFNFFNDMRREMETKAVRVIQKFWRQIAKVIRLKKLEALQKQTTLRRKATSKKQPNRQTTIKSTDKVASTIKKQTPSVEPIVKKEVVRKVSQAPKMPSKKLSTTFEIEPITVKPMDSGEQNAEEASKIVSVPGALGKKMSS